MRFLVALLVLMLWSSNAHAFLLTGGSTSGGGGGAVSLGVNATFLNNGGSTLTTPCLSQGLNFQKGDIPTGSSVQLRKTDGTTIISNVQQDQESYWSDGSLKFAAVSFCSPDSPTSGSTLTYQEWSNPVAPNRTPNVTLAQLAANHDFKLKFTGGDLGSDTWQVSVNDIITSGTAWPWSPPSGKTDPIMGWVSIRAGPSDTEWLFWAYFKRTSDNALHNWLKGTILVRCWTASNCNASEIAGFVTQPNIYGPEDSGTVGGSTEGKFAFNAALYDGATLEASWGSSSDPRVFTIPAANFTVATGMITLPTAGGSNACSYYNSAFGNGAFPFQLSGSVGTGLSTTTIYWFGCNNQSPTHAYISANITTATDTQTNTVAGWLAGVPDYGPGSILYNNGSLYIETGATNPCTTANTGTGPSGSGSSISDGTCVWAFLGVAFSTQGSGNITVTPLLNTFPASGIALVSQTGERIGIGMTIPTVLQGENFTYLFTKTKAVEPSVSGLTINPVGSCCGGSGFQAKIPFNINSIAWGYKYDATGDNLGDEQVGDMNHSAMRCLYAMATAQGDTGDCQNAKVLSHSFIEIAGSFMEDERGGQPVIINNTAYTNFPAANPNFAFGYGQGSPAPATLSVTATDTNPYNSNYLAYPGIDPTHLARPWVGPYMQTGDYMYFFEGREIANDLNASIGTAAQYTNGGTTYYALETVPDTGGGQCQPRGCAWGTDWLAQTMFFMPSTDPLHQYFSDVYAQNALAITVWAAAQPAAFAALGNFDLSAGHGVGNAAPWMVNMAYSVYAKEAWRSEDAHWLSFMNSYGRNAVLGQVDPTTSLVGNGYYVNQYTTVMEATPGNKTTAYTLWCGTGGVTQATSGLTTCPTPESTGMCQNGTGTCPGDAAPDNLGNSYANWAATACIMTSRAGVTPLSANIATLCNSINLRQEVTGALQQNDWPEWWFTP